MSFCDRCGNENTKIALSGKTEQAVLCTNCFNEMIASEIGVTVETYPEAISIKDGGGNIRTFAIDKIFMPTGISMEAVENKMDGYKFSVLGEFDCNQRMLFKKLVKKVKDGVANTYLEEEKISGHRFLTMVGDRVIGRIEYNEESDTPLLNIDGRPYTWEEIGKMMMSKEGFQFRLDIVDITDEFE
ncbi:hypothetical protein MUB24_05925 [Lederbergia sp. NSJ-179]|uniref:DUF7686 domain-containing protein n=1 Tax=Lederbergia sp. NSJ-179 TaxID=2931402 RepID=UPI001FD26A81|nr:hypothetical protein [Lederbergia sp. NSJ-179]MCJ7840463.1 hypothetical protein [Lederbergia sp. NSJ-179]